MSKYQALLSRRRRRLNALETLLTSSTGLGFTSPFQCASSGGRWSLQRLGAPTYASPPV